MRKAAIIKIIAGLVIFLAAVPFLFTGIIFDDGIALSVLGCI